MAGHVQQQQGPARGTRRELYTRGFHDAATRTLRNIHLVTSFQHLDF